MSRERRNRQIIATKYNITNYKWEVTEYEKYISQWENTDNIATSSQDKI